MKKQKEELLNVPLKPKTKAMLKRVAAQNGRAMAREAANIIERDVAGRSTK